MATPRVWLFGLLGSVMVGSAVAGASCCASANPDAVGPKIPDPTAIKPDFWDDEEDGEPRR